MWLMPGVLTPYGGTTLSQGSRTVLMGSRLTLGSGLQASLEGRHQTQAGSPTANQGVQLRVDWQF